MNNIIDILFEKNKKHSEKIAFRDSSNYITYGQLETRTRQVATWLQNNNVRSQDRVNIVLYDKIDTVIIMCATILIGAVACIVNPRGRVSNILYQTQYVDAKVTIVESNIDLQESILINDVIAQSSKLNLYMEKCSTTLDDLSLMLWTSGTTGNSKAVMLNQRHYLETSQLIGIDTIGITSSDKIYTTAKLFFAIGIVSSFFWNMYASAEAYLESNLSTPAKIKENIEKYQPTIFYSVPIVYGQLANKSIKCVAKCLSGGDRLPQSIIDKWFQYTGQLIYNTSGLTEGVCNFTYNRLGTTDAGTINNGYSMRVVDDSDNVLSANQVGKLQIKSKFRALGYYKDDEWSKKVFGDEWLSTGDYAYITESGQLNYMGRINDVIKINGQFINPGEIEETLLNYSGVEQAAVISRLGPDDLERVEAYIVPADNSKLDVREIRRWLLNYHEKHTCPRIIHLVDKLPRTDTGKVQRYLLKHN